MDAAMFKLKLTATNEQLTVAETQLDAGMRQLAAGSGADASALSKVFGVAVDKLRDARKSIGALDELLQVEPVEAARDCPVCKKSVRAAATLCGFCWVKLTPVR